MTNLTCAAALAAVVLVGTDRAAADQAEDRALDVVKRVGGAVDRDEKQPGMPVVAVNLYNSRVTDADLKELAAFRKVIELDLMSTGVTDAGMAHLAALVSLTRLNLQ